MRYMRPAALFFLVLLLTCFAAHATSISNVPPREDRDIVIEPGLHREYDLGVGGAEKIATSLIVSPEIAAYAKLDDPAPGQGPRSVRVIIDVPQDAIIPPNVYGVTLTATEIPQSDAQVSTAVSISLGLTLRRYSPDPILEINDVTLLPVPKGEKANFTVRVISRSLAEIPIAQVKVHILDSNQSSIAEGGTLIGPIPSGATVSAEGVIDTSSLDGGVYRSLAVVTYGPNITSYNRSILRVGTLTIDLGDYTKQLVFNQTNRFVFQVKSNWNKPLTRVSATVNLLDQTKRGPEVSIPAFDKSEPIEVYFDRTATPPGPIEGSITIRYEEKNPDPALQDTMETHEFTIPISVDLIIPPQQAAVTSTWSPSTKQIILGIVGLLVIINTIVIVLLLRWHKTQPKQPV